MNRLLPAFGLLVLLLLGPRLAACSEWGEPYFETIPGSPELANGIVTALAQDRRGLLWFGTPEGLYSFDGYRWREYRTRDGDPNTLTDDYVRALLARPDGSVWVATQGGGISIYQPEQDRFVQLRHQANEPNSLASDAPVAIAQQSDGVVWIGHGAAGLDRYDSRSGQFEHFRKSSSADNGPAHDTVRALLLDRRGDLWIGSGDGLQRRRAGSTQFERIASGPGVTDSLAGQYVYALFEAEDGRIWIGTQTHGAAVLDPKSLILRRFYPGKGERQLAHPWVDGFVEPWPGRLWLASFGGGIDVLDTQSGNVVQRLRADPAIPGSLAMDRVLMPLRDTSGLIWLGTWGGGLQRHNPSNARTFRALRHSPTRANALSHPSVQSLLEIEPGTLWLGTGGNGIDVFELERGVVGGYRPDLKRAGALRDGTVRALAQTTDGQRWVGTQQAGLHRWRRAHDDFELVQPELRIRCLLASQRGTLLIGLQDGLQEFDPRTGALVALHFGAAQPFKDATWSLAEDVAGNLWVGTPNGLLWRRANEQVLQASAVPGLGLRAVMDLKFDAAGVLWVAGPGALARLTGWDALKQPRFEPYVPRAEGVPIPLFGRQLQFDRQGALWSPRQRIQTANAQVDDFGTADGVAPDSVQVGASLALGNGWLIFGGSRGLLAIDPPRFQPWHFEAPLLATAASIDGRPSSAHQLAQGLQLAPTQTRLSVEFAALDYSAPEKVQYHYRLAGYEEAWVAAEAGVRIASYNNLWPGDYRLQVRARGRTGAWGAKPLELAVRVRPRWWQTVFTPIIGFVLLGLVILGVSSLRTRRLARREQILRALVDQRTVELSQAKSRAESALAELQGAQTQLVAAEKMASLGQLVAGVAHEINTPIGIALTAASHLEDIAKTGRAALESGQLSKQALARWQSDSAEAMRLVRTSLERAAVLVASFKQVSVDQSSEQRRQFELQPFLREIVTALAPSLKHTPHRLELECPEAIVLDTYPGALFQIITNLVNNAVLHAFPKPRAGHMSLRAKPLDAQMLELCFSDDGVGMAAATAQRAFDPFFTTRRGEGGSGLGLHVVHNLVYQLLGGSIELSSELGLGTKVLIRIPLQAER